MPKNHFNSFDRDRLQVLMGQGIKKSVIANSLNKHLSSIYRETARNSTNGIYISGRAQVESQDRRYKEKPCPKTGNRDLMKRVECMIFQCFSPQQVSGRLKREFKDQPEMHISTESIYTHIYRQIKEGIDFKPYLRQGRRVRRKRLSGKEMRGSIPNRTMIDQRPLVVESKDRCGDWEGDTIEGAFKQGYIATFVDRNSKYLIGVKILTKSAKSLCKGARRAFKDVPLPLCHTLTLDNGKEFSAHKKLASQLKLDVFFARPYHSWERGLNEHTNGLLRQYFPKGMSFYDLTHQALAKAIEEINNRPRKILDYRTPKEVFEERKFALQI